jgi:hypothetical protein
MDYPVLVNSGKPSSRMISNSVFGNQNAEMKDDAEGSRFSGKLDRRPGDAYEEENWAGQTGENPQ